MQNIDACCHLEHFQLKMNGGADTGRRAGEFSGLRFGERDQFFYRFGRHTRMYYQQRGRIGDVGHCTQIAHGIKAHSAVHARNDCNSRAGAQHGVAIGLGAYHHFRTDLGACARAVVHDDLLAPDFGKPSGQRAADQIDRAAGRVRIDHAHRAGGKIALRKCSGAPYHRCSAACCEQQKIRRVPKMRKDAVEILVHVSFLKDFLWGSMYVVGC